MKFIKRYQSLAVFAVALWLLGNWLGAHSHFCFDGQEPPASVHMHMLGDHLEHGEEVHQDADVDLPQSALAKLTKLDQSFILLAVITLLLVLQPKQLRLNFYSVFIPSSLLFTRPPLRAPPLSA